MTKIMRSVSKFHKVGDDFVIESIVFPNHFNFEELKKYFNIGDDYDMINVYDINHNAYQYFQELFPMYQFDFENFDYSVYCNTTENDYPEFTILNHIKKG